MIKFIIAQGVGFSPGSVKFIPTLGFGTGIKLINVEEAITVGENVTIEGIGVAATFDIIVTDVITIGSAQVVDLTIRPNIEDAVTVGSIQVVDLTVRPDVEDAVTLDEDTTRAHILLQPNISDAITIGEPSPPMDRPIHILLQPSIQEDVTVARPMTQILFSYPEV